MAPVPDATIEWLTVADPVVAVLAVRPVPTQALSIAMRPDRLLRLRRPGAAPVTLRGQDLVKRGRWTVGPSQSGGELVVIQTPTPVRAVKYVVRGPGFDGIVGAIDDWSSLGGLRSGFYEIRSLYPGDVEGVTRRTEVKEHDSAVLIIPPEDVGGVRVPIAADACSEVTHLTAEQSDKASPSVTARRVVANVPLSGQCEVYVAGLRPGRYEVSASSATTGFRIARAVEIETQAIAVVALGGPLVRVFGQVTVASRPPAQGTRIAFEPLATVGERQTTTVALLPDGTFEARLPRSGEYRALLGGGPLPILGAERVLMAQDGFNRLDWNIDGGSVTVTIENWDRSTPIHLQLKIAEPQYPQGALLAIAGDSVVEPNQQTPFTVSGLAFGEFVIEGVQRRQGAEDLTTGPQSFRLSSDEPKTAVTLNLQAYSAAIRLTSSSGAPLSGAAVTSMDGRLLELSPGVYRMTARLGSAGTPLQIRASGYAPTCVLAPRHDATETVPVRAGRQVIVRMLWNEPIAGRALPGELHWSGMGCWVPLQGFSYQLRGATQGSAEFMFLDLPAGVPLTYRIPGFFPPTLLTPGPDGVITIQLPVRMPG
jgi:hypothetical protein